VGHVDREYPLKIGEFGCLRFRELGTGCAFHIVMDYRRWVPLLVVIAGGCGHTDEEMMVKEREIQQLTAELKLAKEQLVQDNVAFERTSTEITALRDATQKLERATVRGLVDVSQAEKDAADALRRRGEAVGGAGHRYEEHSAHPAAEPLQ
jgi:hypothetical protein